MKNSRMIRTVALIALGAAAFVSCSDSAKVSAEIEGLPSSEIVVRQQNVSRYDVVDTVKTDAQGRFSCKISIAKNDPDFVYLYYRNAKIASLLLKGGDKVEVKADTLGNWTVSGSEESSRLLDVEKRYAAFSRDIEELSKAYPVKEGQKIPQEFTDRLVQKYTAYYRESVRYIMSNSHSLTVVPVFYQTVANSFFVFSQDTDAIHFRNTADSLSTVYPDSKYVKALRNEAEQRSNLLEMRVRMDNAPAVGYPDLNLPDVNGRKIRLTEVDAKVVLIHFWTSTDPVQKMFNLEVLKGIYADYHPKGLEIYQVAIDVDKPSWARVVEAQGLEWINVCDGLGTSSPAVLTYNLSGLPVSFIIADGNLTDTKLTDEASLRKALDRLLE